MENTFGMEMLANGGPPPHQQQGYAGGGSRPQPVHLARYPPQSSYAHQQFQQQQQYQQQQQQYQQQCPGYHQQQQQYFYQQQQQQQQYLQQVQMSSSPEYNALRGSSPVSSGGGDRSGSPPQCGGRSPRGGWSSETDSSGFSSPPSDAGGRGGDEWDLLSDMLIEDALASAPVPPSSVISASINFQQGLYKQPPQYLPMAPTPQFNQQQQQQQQILMTSSSLLPAAPNSSSGPRSHSSVSPHPIQKNLQTPPAAASAPSSPPQDAVSSSSIVTGSQSIQPANISPAQRVRANTKRAAATAAAATTTAGAAAAPVKVEPVSTEEQKKLRRRTQIATSVQRHREKKKTLVSALKQDLSSLTSQLEFLRSQRKIIHANDRMVEWEEIAITQRRKRKQSEEVNERMKKALFQQTSFLFGMRAMMNDLPVPRELQFHDWIHSYTVLSARDAAGRRREYASYFSESKMDLASKIVVRETEGAMARLNRSQPYYANVLLLHDGTHVFANELDVPVKRELQQDCYDVGNGQVMKKYTSIFLFEDNGDISFDTFHQVAWECTKQVGVFWPGAGYQSRIQDVVEVGGKDSRVYFTDLSASMGLLDNVQDEENQCVRVESRMLCREQKLENESIILWDYVDRDDLYPLPLGEEALRKKTITRKSCGAVVVRKEPGGLVSIRSTSIKIFDTTLPSSEIKKSAQSQADTEAIASMNRRLGLQATEAERGQQKCIRYVYDAILATFAAAAAAAQNQ